MKKRQFPHSYVIVFFLIIITTILTWIIPAGEFNQITILTNEGQKTSNRCNKLSSYRATSTNLASVFIDF